MRLVRLQDALLGDGVMNRQGTSPWTQEREAEVSRLWIAGNSAGAIARAVSTSGFKPSRNAIIGKIHRLGLTGRGAPKGCGRHAAWNPATAEKAKRLIDEGYSRRAAAEAVGVSYQAIHSKARRDGWKPLAGGPTIRANAYPRGERAYRIENIRPPKPKPDDAYLPLPGSTPGLMMGRGRFECSWPVGGKGMEMLACCQPVEPPRGNGWQSSWCATHNALGRAPTAKMSSYNPDRSVRRVA